MPVGAAQVIIERELIHHAYKALSQSRAHAVQFSSVQDGISALEKAHMRSTPSLRRFPSFAFETVPMFV